MKIESCIEREKRCRQDAGVTFSGHLGGMMSVGLQFDAMCRQDAGATTILMA
jgi:hypothetical protein